MPTTSRAPMILVLAAVAAPALAQPVETPLPAVRPQGCDGLVGSLSGVQTYGNATVNGELVRAFAVGTNTWNIGNRPMEWVSGGSNHPKLFQNIYRAKGKQFHHVALGWGKRGFAVANGTINSGWGPCVTTVTGGTAPSRLGINCTDPYGAGTNAGQNNLGPRFDVNPITGAFTPGNATGLIPAVSTSNIDRRCVGLDADFKPPASTGATYYAEAFAVTPDDAQWGNSRNNYSSRKLAAFPTLNNGASSQTINFASTPNFRYTALEHFAADTAATLTYTDFHERNNTFLDKYDGWDPGETSIVMRPSPVSTTAQAFGRFITTSHVTDNGDGTWTYDLAIMNVNSHRSGGSVRLRLAHGVADSGQSTFIPAYHSGDRFRNAPWNYSTPVGMARWDVDPATEQRAVAGVGTVTFNPNAIMFGAVHSYRITVNKAPATKWLRMGLFRPAADAFGYQGNSLAITSAVVPDFCEADVGGQGGQLGPDGLLDNNDFVVFVDRFFANDLDWADIGGQGSVAMPDNRLDNNDFVRFVDAFFSDCL